MQSSTISLPATPSCSSANSEGLKELGQMLKVGKMPDILDWLTYKRTVLFFLRLKTHLLRLFKTGCQAEVKFDIIRYFPAWTHTSHSIRLRNALVHENTAYFAFTVKASHRRFYKNAWSWCHCFNAQWIGAYFKSVVPEEKTSLAIADLNQRKSNATEASLFSVECLQCLQM